MFVTLAGVLAIVGTLAAGYHFATRPVTLRIAVGPANSDDLKVVQALTQALTTSRTARSGCARCRPTAPLASAKALGDEQGRSRDHPRRSRRAQECAGRGDAAQERRGAVGAARQQGQGQGQESRTQDHQDHAARRTSHRRRRPHRGQCQFAQGDPGAIRRRSGQGRDRPVPGHRSRRRHSQPEGGCLSRGRTGQQQDHHGCDRGFDARRRHADLPRDRFGRSDCAKPSGLRGIRNSRRHLRRRARQAGRGSQDDQLLASHRGAEGHVRTRPSRSLPGSCLRSGKR